MLQFIKKCARNEELKFGCLHALMCTSLEEAPRRRFMKGLSGGELIRHHGVEWRRGRGIDKTSARRSVAASTMTSMALLLQPAGTGLRLPTPSPLPCRAPCRRGGLARAHAQLQPLPLRLPRRVLLALLAASVPVPVRAAVAASVAVPLPPPSFLRSLGLGDADIYYPSFFAGTWNCLSTLTAVETPQGEDKADRRSVEFSRKQLGFTVEYQARFVPFDGHVIGDRSFTTSSLVESTMGKDVIKAASWDPHQPNRLALTLRGGVKVENVVTKRSAEVTGPGQFDTSEFSKQVFDNSAIKDGPPSVKASQNLTRYRWNPTETTVNEIEAFQRIAMFPLPSEGNLDLADVMGMDKPVTLYKYRVKFTRVVDP